MTPPSTPPRSQNDVPSSLRQGKAAPLPGLDNYDIGAPLARGGMSSVMVAEDRKLRRQVAIKSMSLDAFSDDSLRRRFVREAHVLAQLAHPNIVPIYDIQWEDGIPQFYTMKLVKGRTLQEVLDDLGKGTLENQRSLRLDDLLNIFLKVCDAIAFAHAQGIIHRDLKPANIMVGEFGEVLVMDWGLAGLIDDLKTAPVISPMEAPDTLDGMSLTLPGAIMGTPRYMSPEQAAGHIDRVGPESDIYSLGAILYTILTLRPPVKGDSVNEVLSKISRGDVLPPSSFAAASGKSIATAKPGDAPSGSLVHCPGGRVPAALSSVTMRALAPDPQQRYRSPVELSDDIHAYMSGFATSAEDIGAFGQSLLFMKRHKVITASLMVIVLITSLFILRLAASAEAERKAAEGERRTAESERRTARTARSTAYSATLAQALASREHHDFGKAQGLLEGIAPEQRGFDWRLLNRLCRGDELHSFAIGNQPGSEPQSLAIIADGTRMAILTADGHLHLRDTRGKPLQPPRRLPTRPDRDAPQRYSGLSFSPDGTRFAYVTGDTLRVHDADSMEVLHDELSREPQFAWLDNHRLLYGFNGSVEAPPYPGAGAWIIDLAGAKDEQGNYPRTGFPKMCAPLAVSPDRKFFVLHSVNTAPSSWERSLNLFPADSKETDEPVFHYKMPGVDYPGLIAISHNATHIAYTGGLYNYLSRSAHVLEVATGRLLFDQKFEVPINDMALDPKDQSLGLVGGDGVVRVYNFTRGLPEDPRANTYDDKVALEQNEPIPGNTAHAPPTDLMTRTAQDGRTRFYLGHKDRVFALAFSERGALFSAGSDLSIRQWTTDDGHSVAPALRFGHVDTRYDRELPVASEDGSRLLFTSSAQTLLCDVTASLTAGQAITSGIGDRIAPLAILRDGRMLLLRRYGFEVLLAEPDESVEDYKSVVKEMTGDLFGNGRPRSAVLSQDETRLAIAFPKQLFSVNLETGRAVASRVFGQRTGRLGIASHDLSPDGKWIASSGFGPQVSIHRFESPDEIVHRLGGEPRDFDTAVVFSRNGSLLYTGNEDGHVRVWETTNWKELPELGFKAHRGPVSAIALSHEGKLIATSGDDTLKIFPLNPEEGVTGRRERLTIPRKHPANWLKFTRDQSGNDRALVHSSPAGTLEVWDCDSRKPDSAMPTTPPTGRIPVHRLIPGVVQLKGGQILFVGGSFPNKVPHSDCYLYDPAHRIWKKTGSLRTPRGEQFGLEVLPDGRVLAAGGRARGGVALASSELYDPASGSWQTTGSMGIARDGGTCASLPDGRVLMIGARGDNSREDWNSCEIYDPRTEAWTPTGRLKQAAYGIQSLRLMDGRVLAYGHPPRSHSWSLGLYEPDTGEWTEAEEFPRKSAAIQAVQIPSTGEVLFIFQTEYGSSIPSSCFLYNPTTKAWRPTGPLPMMEKLNRGSLTALPDGRILFVSGFDSREQKEPFSSQVAFYDPKTNSWTEAPGTKRQGNRQEAILLGNGKVLLIGGRDERGVINDVETYDPGGQ